MADVTRGSSIYVEMSRTMLAPQTKAPAGEDLAAGDVVYCKASDGKLYKADGDAADEKARFWGIVPAIVKAGEAAVAFGIGAKIKYFDTAIAVGTRLFISVNAGNLADAASTGGTIAVARVCPLPNGGGTSDTIEIIAQGN